MDSPLMISGPTYTVKKVIDFPVPIRDVTNQTLPGGEYLVIPAMESLFSDIPARDGKIDDLFFTVYRSPAR
jgi:hypothetical protein